MDGHTGTEISELKKVETPNFQLILASLKDKKGRVDFVIHASSNVSYTPSGISPLDFLEKTNFSPFKGNCTFHHDRCRYRSLGYIESAPPSFERRQEVEIMHRDFNYLSERIEDLYSLVNQQSKILQELQFSSPGPSIFGDPIKIEISETNIPIWMDEVKLERLKEIERNIKEFEEEMNELRGYLPLLYGKSDVLVDAVMKALHFLGLDANKTEPGFTADILAKTKDDSKKFGIEVTGISGPVKKDSNKLTQVVDFERIKEHDEKTILLANTHNTIPISEREKLEDFTPQVIDFLSRHPILLMTGWDMYRMLKDVMEKDKDPAEIIEALYTTDGLLNY